jgi:hypothetical protein
MVLATATDVVLGATRQRIVCIRTVLSVCEGLFVSVKGFTVRVFDHTPTNPTISTVERSTEPQGNQITLSFGAA